MRGCIVLFASILLSPSSAQTQDDSLVPTIVADQACYKKGEIIRAKFENIEGTGVWIGLYPKKHVEQVVERFGNLPDFSEEKLTDWILTCGQRECVEWPSGGIVELDTDELTYGQYFVAVSGDRGTLNSQAHSESFIVDAHCPTPTSPPTTEDDLAGRHHTDPHRWIPPRTGDQRSPCPFVNTIANHGFINRNGTNIDISDMANKLEAVYNVAAEFLHQGPIQQMIDCNQTYEDEDGVRRFDLDILFDDNCEEHEASMVRADSFFGFEKSKQVDDGLLNNLMRRNPGQNILTLDDVFDYQADRIMTSRLINPETEFRHFDVNNMGAQGIFLFLLSSDKTMMTVEKDRLYFFLLDEKLPDEFVPGSLRDTPFNPRDSTDFVHDRLMRSMENVESMIHVPIAEAMRHGHNLNNLHSLHGIEPSH